MSLRVADAMHPQALFSLYMSDYEKRVREYMRAKKRQEREELRIAREIGRARKDQEKADELEKARLEVAEYRARLDVALSLHREVGEEWNWQEILNSLPPYPPVPTNRRETRELQNLAIAGSTEQKKSEGLIEEARKGDRLENEAAQRAYAEEKAEWERMTALARRILVGDVGAYRDVVIEFSPLSEMESLGSSIEVTTHSRLFIECVLTMEDTSAIPAEVKSLMANGRLSVKAMPRQQFHEIYQDYICGGVLRAAREMFALLPVEDVLVTVIVPLTEIAGQRPDKPVLSTVVSRGDINRMDFTRLDPSDTIEELVFRGDFKATRKIGAFQPIVPIRYEDVVLPSYQTSGIDRLLLLAANLRNEMKEELAKLQEV